ncbi:MAG: c-type cytochrome, partial [Pseudomonadales bacterium]|nr:c-type cytochrome [Pseudomonadales bacterium]
MKPIILKSNLSTVVGMLASLSISSLAFAADAPASSTFTALQFERGEALYEQQCATCHGAELDSAAAPELIGVTFRKSWSRLGANVGELFNRISTTMPPSDPGSLSESQSLDVLAYVLGRNNVLEGTEALKNDYNYLSAIPLSRGDEVLDSAATFIEGIYGTEPSGTGPSFQELLTASTNSKDWLYHNQNYQGTRYSELLEIDTGNAADLEQVCAYQLNTNATMQTGPIVYRGVMYVTNATHTAAINAATCQR